MYHTSFIALVKRLKRSYDFCTAPCATNKLSKPGSLEEL